MKTVLHVVETLDPFGGTPQKLLFKVRYAKNVRHLVFCTNNPGLLAPEFVSADVKVVSGSPHLWMLPFTILQIIRLLHRERVDVVHAHFFRSRLIGYILRLFAGCPLIVSEHGAVPERRWWVRAIDSVFLGASTPVICNSEATRRQFCSERRNCGNPTVIYNGVPDVHIAEKSARNVIGSASKIRFVAVGGFTEWRRYDVLLQGLSIIASKGMDFEMVIIGDGPLKDELVYLRRTLCLDTKVVFRGYLDRDQVLREVEASDIFINCARNEGFGIATVEAMLLKRVVVLADAGSLSELAPPTDLPQYFCEGNPNDLAVVLKRILDNREYWQSIGGENRHRALEMFDVEKFVNSIETVYLSAVK